MMRRLLLPAFLACIIAPCSGGAFLSNALGHDLGAIEALTGAGYEGERNGGTTTIYLDGEPVMTRTEDENGYRIAEGDTVEEVSYGSDGLRTERRLITPGREEVHTYFYSDDGSLSSVSVSVNGSLERRTVYLETPSGSLAGLSGSSSAYIMPSFYQYDLDGDTIRFSYHEDGRVIRENLSLGGISYEVLDDGSWSETETLQDGSVMVRIYSPDGRLASQSDGSVMTRYEYDENGDIVSETVSEGALETIRRYADGSLASIEEKRDGSTERIRTYLDSGDIEEIRYRDGKPEYSVLFGADGMRVKEIHRL